MPMLATDDGVRLHYEEAGSGVPIVFVHEFAGDHRSWEPQLRHFARAYRCIAYNARGYPPSEVPPDVDRYSKARAADDIRAVLDALKIEKAHVVGLSMGANATLHFGLSYPQRALSLTFAGGGYGSHPETRAKFQEESRANADTIRRHGMGHFVSTYGLGPTRVQFQNKDPRGFDEYLRQFREHSDAGSINTLLGVQSRRPSFYAMTEKLAKLEVPLLVMTGDEDEPSLEASLMVKRCAPLAGLAVLPKSGHGINLEEPALFNALLGRFLHEVDLGRWGRRDARSAVASIYGPGPRPELPK
ncbi:MAG: alpha/beta hydrolase [Betaproteobacteria bacterium]|nr:alpha/beta hydrolase [Betaproteobacteria bacterium]